MCKTENGGWGSTDISCAWQGQVAIPIQTIPTWLHCNTQHAFLPRGLLPIACPQPASSWPAITSCSISSSSTLNISQSLCCQLGRKVIAIKDAVFSALQPAWVILNRTEYLLVFKAPCISYCCSNWKARTVCHVLYKCHVLESRAVAILCDVHLLKNIIMLVSLISALHLCWVFTWPVSWSWPQWYLFRSFTPV